MQVGETSKFYRPVVRASPGRKNRFPGRRRRARSRENQTFGFTGAGQLCYNEIHMGRRARTGLGGFVCVSDGRPQTGPMAAARAGIGQKTSGERENRPKNRMGREEEYLMDLTERTLSSETVYQGKIVTLLVDQAELPNGMQAKREVVLHPGGVAILPLDRDGNVTLVQQYRYPFHQLLLELPAGKLDEGEDHRVAAARELSEETGLEAGELTYLGCILASPGFCTEKLHMYLARDLSRAQSHPDDDEFLNVVTMPFEELVQKVMDGTLEDAKTVATVLKTKVLLNL